MQTVFGSGVLYGVPLTTASGAAVANPTPIKFGVVQDVSVDFSFSMKELYGQKQFPVAIGRGTAKVGGKAKFARINGLMLNSLFFGQSLATTTVPNVAVDEAGTIPGTPYAVTVTNSASFTRDLGVVYSATGLPLQRVASAPATGQYSVAAGVYTFAAADTTLGVLISYEYTESVGQKLVISNQQLGYQPSFLVELTSPYNAKKFVLTLNKCVANKLTFATKLEDFMVPEFDFSAFTDEADNLGSMAISEL